MRFLVCAPTVTPGTSKRFAQWALFLVLAVTGVLPAADAKSSCCLDSAETGFVGLRAHDLRDEIYLPSGFDEMVELARLDHPDAVRHVNEIGDDSVSRALRFLALRKIEAGNFRDMMMLLQAANHPALWRLVCNELRWLEIDGSALPRFENLVTALPDDPIPAIRLANWLITVAPDAPEWRKYLMNLMAGHPEAAVTLAKSPFRPELDFASLAPRLQDLTPAEIDHYVRLLEPESLALLAEELEPQWLDTEVFISAAWELFDIDRLPSHWTAYIRAEAQEWVLESLPQPLISTDLIGLTDIEAMFDADDPAIRSLEKRVNLLLNLLETDPVKFLENLKTYENRGIQRLAHLMLLEIDISYQRLLELSTVQLRIEVASKFLEFDPFGRSEPDFVEISKQAHAAGDFETLTRLYPGFDCWEMNHVTNLLQTAELFEWADETRIIAESTCSDSRQQQPDRPYYDIP